MNVEAPSEGLRSRKKEKTRRAIEDAALELFAEQGYEATTVNQIAERAEVSTATFFRYFGTKQEVIFAEDGNEFAELRRAVVECPAGEDDLERGALRHPRRLGAYARRQAHLPPGPGGGIVTLAAWAEFRSRSALATRHQRGARAPSRARRPGPAMRAGGHRRIRSAEQRRQCLGGCRVPGALVTWALPSTRRSHCSPASAPSSGCTPMVPTRNRRMRRVGAKPGPGEGEIGGDRCRSDGAARRAGSRRARECGSERILGSPGSRSDLGGSWRRGSRMPNPGPGARLVPACPSRWGAGRGHRDRRGRRQDPGRPASEECRPVHRSR